MWVGSFPFDGAPGEHRLLVLAEELNAGTRSAFGDEGEQGTRERVVYAEVVPFPQAVTFALLPGEVV
jgi:hypothetical protein